MQDGPLTPRQLQVAIIGGGATGVELAAELHKATRTLVSCNLEKIDPERDIRLNLLEAGPRILPALPERIAGSATDLLRGLGVKVRTGARVTAVTAEGVQLASGELLPAELVVWAAGVKAPDFLRGQPHQVALHGYWKTALGSASRWLTRSTEPRVKLH